MVDICRSKPQKGPLDHDFAWVGTFFQAVMTTRFAEYVNVSNEKKGHWLFGFNIGDYTALLLLGL